MAKIDIKYSTGDIVATSGISETRPADLSGAIDLLGGIAKRDMDRISQKEALEQAAIDSNYNANETVRLNSELYSIKEKHKQLLIDAPEKYQATVMGELSGLFNQSLDSAPSIKAKMAMTQQIAQMKIHAGISTANDASEARAVVDRSNFMDNSDKLSAQVLENPESYEVAKLQMSKLLEAFKTRAKSPEEYVRAVQFQNDRLDLVFLQGVADKSPEKALELAKSDKFSHLGADNLAKINLDAYQNIEARVREEEKKMQEAQEAVVLDIKSRLAKSRDLSSANNMVSEILHKQDQLGKNFPSILNEAYNNYDQWKSKQEEVVRVASYINSGVHLEPGNKKDEERADIAFDQFRDIYNKAEPQEKTNILLSWVDRVGILPPSVEKGLMSAMSHGNPKQKVQAAMTFDALLERDPRLLRQLGGNMQQVALANKISLNVSYGMSEVDAVTSAEKDVIEGALSMAAQDPRRVAKVKLYEANRKKIELGEFTSFFKADPDELDPAMLAEMEDYKRQLVLNFNVPEDKAHERAVAMGKARWGHTKINGELKFVRNPPEKIFGNGKDASWVREQFHSEVKKIAILPSGAKVSPDKLIATPLPDYLSKDGLPAYAVTHQTGDIPEPVLHKNKKGQITPFIWRPSIGTTPQADKANMLTKENVAKLNSEANQSAVYRYRKTVLENALKRNDITPEMKKRIRQELNPIGYKEGPAPTRLSDTEFNDIKPVNLGGKQGENLNIGRP